MSSIWKPHNLLFWYLIPVALSIHGLILCVPINLEKEPTEKPKTAPVKMQKLPSTPFSTPVATPVAAPVVASPPPSSPPAGIQSPIEPLINQVTIPPAVQQPAQSAPLPVQPAPLPVQPAPIAPVRPPAVPPVVPPPDVFQIQGATACISVKDCYTSPETNGRSIARTLEEKLQAEGYTLEPMDLAEDTGMKIYHLFRNGQPQDYLHIVWNDRGTSSLRLPQPEKSRDQLALKAKL